jgi:hypothetical protein
MTKSVSTSELDADLAPLWDEALGHWASKASWFGLHGHILMSTLAALNLQIVARTQAAHARGSATRESHGARASAFYSIGNTVTDFRRKLYHYKQALLAADMALERDPEARQGTLAIKGHVLMRRAMLGRPHEIFSATEALTGSFQLRQRGQASDASLGEAMTDFGFCRVLALQPWKGLPLIREGVELLRSDPSANGRSFLARGLHKLERASTITLNRSAAAGARAEQLAIAEGAEAFDQIPR